MKLGVFDSGIGGEAVATALRQTFPGAIIHTTNDRQHLPYGDKTPEQIRRYTNAALQPFLDGTYDVIILACNTATTLAIEQLRATYPQQQFIGIEPMIKPAAAATTSGIIAVCATPATLASARYAELVQKYGSQLTIIEPDCRKWADWIENNQVNREHITQAVTAVCDQGADVIVLGCTHYHWIKKLVVEIADDRATVLEPSEAIGRRVTALL